MNTLLRAASDALQKNDADALEDLKHECEQMCVQGYCLPRGSEDLRSTGALVEIVRRQVEAARQHLAICNRLGGSPRKDFTLWER